MKNRLLLLVLLAFGLTNCAYREGITKAGLHQIQPGVTTEADLAATFGPPDTRVAAYNGDITLAWFRSVGPPPAGYVPTFGQFMGGLDLDVQQLTVKVNHAGRVRSYWIYDSTGAVHTDTRTHTKTTSVYGK